MSRSIRFAGIATKKQDSSQPELVVYHSYNPALDQIIPIIVSHVDIYVNHKKSFEASVQTKGHTVQYMVYDEVLYVTAALSNFPQRLCFRLLQKIAEEFEITNFQISSEKDRSSFEQQIQRLMDFYSDDPKADSLRELSSKVDEVTDIMTDNIRQALNKGEGLESLVSEVSRLENNAGEFRVMSKKLKCALCIQNCKWFLITIVLIVVCVLILLAIVAGLVYYFVFM